MDPDSPIDEQEKDLFVGIFRQLSAYKDPYQSISGILKDTCEFFGFFGAFVYEADHAKVFHLFEHYRAPEAGLREQFVLSDYLSERDIKELTQKPGGIVYLKSKKTRLGAKFLELFSAKTLIMIPIIFEYQEPTAFIGMLDRRHPIRLTKREVVDADAVLSVLAGHIKMRVYQKRLEYAYSSLRNVIDKAGLDIYVNDFYTHELLFANESLAAPHGGVDKIEGQPCWKALYFNKTEECEFCPKNKLVDADGNPTQVYSWDMQRSSDGSWFRMVHAAIRWVDGRLAHVVSSIDITENKYNEMLVRRLAECDTLTSLPNRGKLVEDMNGTLAMLEQTKEQGYLIFLDLDDFKQVNDTLGHLAGDALLRQIGHFLQNESAILGMPYRYGGDEFVIIAANKTAASLEQIQELLLKRFALEWCIGEQSVFCGVSIGAVRIPLGNKTADDLVHAADMAMYEVKKSGKHGFRLSTLE
ncbi:GGDEF/EAL/PAS/PAC domain protein [Treponema primitia ZAS-2]|uniref:GGDEF/EAL/PAS/PAC domain protein n=1 Tax=Treponema primitia (strain ATCC BAA-887 / DSM 12427 / ZAS-2) TaxID=545694 RepID=F5YHT6_TREPZ|nr:GGDEF/EAL/PAS/PAC domain protein [Treponema primitia ZAS-2]